MSNISDKLIRLSNIKSDIKTAINNKGQSVGDDFSTYANAINNITTGEGSAYENPDFYEVRTNGGTNYKGLFSYCNTPSLDLSSFDTSKATDMSYMFNYCSTPSLDLSSFDTSKVTNMSYMFNYCSSSIKGIENWDTSKVTDVSYMFGSFTNNNTYLDLSVLDFSNVSNVEYMFYYSNTDYLDVRNINLTGTTNYERLFNYCSGTEIDLSSWDIKNVTNLNRAFYSAKYQKIDLTGWSTINVTNMTYLFSGTSLTTLLIPDWDMTNTTTTSSMFSGTSALKYIDASRCNDTTMTKLSSLILARTLANYGEIITPADLAQETIDALIAKYWKPIGPKFDLISTELVFELDEIKPGKTTKVWTGNSNPWYGDDSLETIEFISSDMNVVIDGREITGMGEGTTEIIAMRREDGEVLGSTTLTVSETDSKPNLIKFRTDGREGTSNILVVNGSNIKASQCTKDVAGIYSYDPGKQITSIKFYYGMSTCYVNEIVKFNFNAANITDTSTMFQYYQGTTLDLSDWDTSRVTKFNQMFGSSSYLTEIKGELDLSSAISPIGVFDKCPNLETVYLKNIYKNSTISDHNLYSIKLEDTKIKDECLRFIINELPDLAEKGITNNTLIVLTLPPSNTLTADDVQVAIDKGWIVKNTTY